MSRPTDARQAAGLSVVTALRDRSAALQAALPSWLARPEIAEIVVVDAASARPLASLGILDVPRVTLVELSGEPAFLPGLARNVGAAVASADTLLLLDCDLRLADADPLLGALRRDPAAFATGIALPDEAPMPGAILVGRAAFTRAGGYHEYLAHDFFIHDDLANRLEDARAPHRFFPNETLGRVAGGEPPRPGGPPGPIPGRVALESGLERTPRFQSERNRILAALVPWTAAFAAFRPRRTGRLAPRHHACQLAPASPFETRQQDVASHLTATLLHDEDCGEAGVEMLEAMVDERDAGHPGRAAAQAQLDILLGAEAPPDHLVPIATPARKRARNRKAC